MNYKIKNISVLLLFVFTLLSVSCEKAKTANSNSSNAQPTQTVIAKSPTEAYKMLYAACKAKDTATIKQLMSKGSMGLAAMSAAQQKKPIEGILENGLVAPTLADSLSEMRDERVKDTYGAVEVFNPKENKWEDLPFVLEDGSWKLAVGDLFQGTYVSPGKSVGQIELEASNKIPNAANFPKTIPMTTPPAANANSNSNKTAETPPKK